MQFTEIIIPLIKTPVYEIGKLSHSGLIHKVSYIPDVTEYKMHHKTPLETPEYIIEEISDSNIESTPLSFTTEDQQNTTDKQPKIVLKQKG